MTSAHPLVLTEGRKLKELASKGRLTTAALTAAGAAILAATQAQAHSGPENHAPHTDDDSSVIGMGLVGATHTHASGLHHNHGPLSLLPNGVQHTHPFGDGMQAGAMPAPMQMQMPSAPMMSYGTYAPQQMASSAMMPMAAYGQAPMMAAPPAHYGNGGLIDGGMLLALGVAGMAGLSALFIFDNDNARADSGFSSSEAMPYLSNGAERADTIFDETVLSITSSSSQQADEGEGGTLGYVTAHHPLGQDVSFSIIGGDDEERFRIDHETGALSFVGSRAPEQGDANNSIPDFSALSGDADGTRAENGNNTLEVRVEVRDTNGNFANQYVTYFIQNETRDDTVDRYVEADDLARLSDNDTNNLIHIEDAEFGQDDNGDNLVISVNGSDRVTVTELEGDGDINTTFFGSSGADYYDVAVGDIDGDGDLDVVVAGRDDGENIVEVWESNGNGSFSREYTADDGSSSSDLDSAGTIADVVLGEFDGSGNLEIFVTNDGGHDSLITLSGNYSGSIETFAGLDVAEEAVVISERYINSSTDYVAALEHGDIALVDVEDGQQEDQVFGSYVDLAVYRDMVFAAEGTRVDVFEADSNSLEDETSGIITGLDRITEIAVGDFDDDDSDIELAVLDADADEVYIYELDQHYDSASLSEVIDVDGGALELLTLPEYVEANTETGGNLADDLLVGGSNSTIFYDDTSL